MVSNLEITGCKKFRRQTKLDEALCRVQFASQRNLVNQTLSKLDYNVVIYLLIMFAHGTVSPPS